MGMCRLIVTALALAFIVVLGGCATQPGLAPIAVVTVVMTAPPAAEISPTPAMIAQAVAEATATPQAQVMTDGEKPAVMLAVAQEDMAAIVGMAVETVIAELSTDTPTPTQILPTSTPEPPDPTATPTLMLVPLEMLTPSATPVPASVPTATPESMPAEVRGKILFLSDRFKVKRRDKPSVLAMDPDGSNVALVTNKWLYPRAKELNRTSPEGTQKLFVHNTSLWVENYDGWREFLFDMGGLEYDPAWAPDSTFVAFVSDLPGNDEIFVWNRVTGKVKRLTDNEWAWDKHPSFSSDGEKVVFWSNRDGGQQQIWIMDVDGSNAVNLSNNLEADYDPVWVK